MSLSIIGATDICVADSTPCYSNLSEVLSCFVNHEDDSYSYKKQSETTSHNVKIQSYIFNSQKWPIEPVHDIPSTIWKHKLTIYVPELVKYNNAMLYVGGGYTATKEGKHKFTSPKEVLDFVNIASSNNAVVIALEDVPNQALFMNNSYKKEDQILAYTYKRVMEDPFKNAYLAGHLPMAKSIIKAMDVAQDALSEQDIILENFMLVGASKRGWATWLAAIEDSRVSAIIPIVIDILNVQKNIDHICSSYKDYCPPALRDYKEEGITEHIKSEAFSQLMQIEDPYSYINIPKYSKQLSIPKYIINSSGDDFYAADSSKFYFKDLPGDNYIRYLPQAMHYLAGNPLSNAFGNIDRLNQAINNYLYYHLNKIELPKVTWEFTENKIIINSSAIPQKVKIWSANNEEERDFRCLHSYSNLNIYPKIAFAYLYKGLSISKSVCDSAFIQEEVIFYCKDENCKMEISVPENKKEWQASFAEFLYNIKSKDFIITTEMLVKSKN